MTEPVPNCPKCGAAAPARIVYGSRDPESAAEVLRDSSLELGGCVIIPTSPAWRCRGCGEGFGVVEMEEE